MEPRKVVMKYKDGNEVTYTLKNFKPNAEMVVTVQLRQEPRRGGDDMR